MEKNFAQFLKKIDNRIEMRYNVRMDKIQIAVIGGGAAGLFLACALQQKNVTVFERGERVGRKLSATGNGQGNVSNLSVAETPYFGSATERTRICEIIRQADHTAMADFFRSLGVILTADERGRMYPASRQASALTDALRFALEEKGVNVCLSTRIVDVEKTKDGFILTAESKDGERQYFAKNVVLCAGGKAAKNFGTDGTAYALAEKFGHSVTALYPSLVQLKTDTAHTKTLKGIRVNDGGLTAIVGDEKVALTGDIIFTDYGVSGDAVFRISAFLADKIPQGQVRIEIDFLPAISETEIYETLRKKRLAFPHLADNELLFGVVNNQIGRAIIKRADGDLKRAATLVKKFPLQVVGSLGFDYAQVTKGGIPLSETDENLQSRFVEGLYFAGEILDVDGQCGGFNLQWAFSSAMRVASGIHKA